MLHLCRIFYLHFQNILSAYAHYSVTIFFTLSGFLITYLLLLEKEQKRISVKNFYIRRILRIWPLYFAYLLVACIVLYIQTPDELPGSLPYYLFLAPNIAAALLVPLHHLWHYWSLGVEEQFYFFWPWLIKRSKNVLKAILIFTMVFIFIKLAARYLYLEKGNSIPLMFLTLTRFECMSIGGIGALLCIKRNQFFFRITTHKFTEIACWLCIALVAANRFFVSYFVKRISIARV